ncbi:MAG TPA: protein-methionine-sulfoxide reductase heme-binding subunit MsrQ [Acidobacteriaceae bacterium]|nr:protein-methionine-sulfoxide reductase heme-binding subunit MsrQ [Acidobacteriaceae bacterium]
MPNRTIVALKWIVFPACLVPLGLLVYHGFTNTLGPDPVARLTHRTGFWTLYLLLISLAITPLRLLSPKLAWLIRFRRMTGLFAFFYGTLHLTVWVWLFSSFDVHAMLHDIAKRPYVTMGMLGWLLMLPLALTSTRGAIRRLGKRWMVLHRLAYGAAVAGVIHYWWIVKSGVRTPWKVTIVLAILLGARIIWTAKENARKKKLAVAV